MRRKRTLLALALAIVSGLVAGIASIRYLQDRPTPLLASESNAETQPVAVAARDLGVGDVLKIDDVRLVDWPVGSVPAGYAGSTAEVIGRSLITDVSVNEPLMATKLADTGLYGLVPLIPPGMRALSVRVDEVVGVAGFVTPRTRVDVILTMTVPGGRDPISKVILQNVQTLAAGQEIQQNEEGEPMTVTVVTVLVSPEDAEKLSLAASQGKIQMALRHTLDLETVETSGQYASRLFSATSGSTARRVIRSAPTSAASSESIIEMYQGGVRTLISY
jgi:pilus assembly protein CpaB